MTLLFSPSIGSTLAPRQDENRVIFIFFEGKRTVNDKSEEDDESFIRDAVPLKGKGGRARSYDEIIDPFETPEYQRADADIKYNLESIHTTIFKIRELCDELISLGKDGELESFRDLPEALDFYYHSLRQSMGIGQEAILRISEYQLNDRITRILRGRDDQRNYGVKKEIAVHINQVLREVNAALCAYMPELDEHGREKKGELVSHNLDGTETWRIPEKIYIGQVGLMVVGSPDGFGRYILESKLNKKRFNTSQSIRELLPLRLEPVKAPGNMLSESRGVQRTGFFTLEELLQFGYHTAPMLDYVEPVMNKRRRKPKGEQS
jgi:hypothetical protein